MFRPEDVLMSARCSQFFFFNDTATTEIYALSLHDALPIYPASHGATRCCGAAATAWTWSTSRARTGSTPSPRHRDRKSTRLNSSHLVISYAVFCLKKKNTKDACVLRMRLRTPDALDTTICI